ncbi:EamA family transporter [uncultured Clostridium sp.]|uniref:EamA family transporter n=1 Tax=uncultured Clostridium sp. TaxID=59620 RepID=UPI0028E8B894|nr:EamA family transporter [uncultured Clostridium sp.]
MFYLLLAILCSSSIALIFKYSESKNINRYTLTSSNYFAASSISLILILTERVPFIKKPSIQAFNSQFSKVIIHNQGLFSPSASLVWAIMCGILFGLFFFSSFIYYQKSVKDNGAGLSGAFSKMGILIPMTFSIILWKETPTVLQWFGILLSLLSITIVNISFDKKSVTKINPSLLLLFFLGGMADFSNKFFQKYALLNYKNVFLFFIFFTAFIISAIFTIRDEKKIIKRDILTGIAVGVPNFFSSFFLILSLDSLTTSVVYPVFSAGSIVFINILSYIIFKEKLMPKEKLSLGFTIISLIFINIK